MTSGDCHMGVYRCVMHIAILTNQTLQFQKETDVYSINQSLSIPIKMIFRSMRFPFPIYLCRNGLVIIIMNLRVNIKVYRIILQTSCEVYQCLQSEQCLLVVAARHSRREEKAKHVSKYVLGQYQSLDTAVRKRSPRIISGKKSDGEWCAA